MHFEASATIFGHFRLTLALKHLLDLLAYKRILTIGENDQVTPTPNYQILLQPNFQSKYEKHYYQSQWPTLIWLLVGIF